jgi:CDP-paratose 2-epimerase
MTAPALPAADRICNFSGGLESAMSLRQLSDWCDSRLGDHAVQADPAPRAFDLPWLVLDSAKAARLWQWRPATALPCILDEIAKHAQAHPEWLDLSAPL